jgi:predicted enzyme related to lactoylglutathione lyase
MLRGMTTTNFYAHDVKAARAWYGELLGVEAYYASEDHGKPAGYVEFRIGDYQHELGILDRRFAAHQSTEPAGATVYWAVDDIQAAVERAVSLGAEEHEPIREQGEGFVTASVVDPFGNILGLMYNQHYLDVLTGCTA